MHFHTLHKTRFHHPGSLHIQQYMYFSLPRPNFYSNHKPTITLWINTVNREIKLFDFPPVLADEYLTLCCTYFILLQLYIFCQSNISYYSFSDFITSLSKSSFNFCMPKKKKQPIPRLLSVIHIYIFARYNLCWSISLPSSRIHNIISIRQEARNYRS